MVKAATRLTFPNERFWDNHCTQCATSGEECHHVPFGQLFDWQQWVLSAISRKFARQLFLELHRRARKSSTLINVQFQQCIDHPKTRHNWIGPTFAEVRRIIWDDPTMLKSALPDDPARYGIKVREHRMMIEFPNGSVWQCYGGEKPDDLRGIDGETFVFDEWAQQDIRCWSEIVQPIWAQSTSRWAAFLYTPKSYNHATQMFDRAAGVDRGEPLPVNGPAERPTKGMFALRLTADHSGIFTPEALQEIQDDPHTTREIYEQEYLCARIADEQFALVTSSMLHALARQYNRPDQCPAIIACDPSMGGDACTISVQWGQEEVEHHSFRTRDTMRIAGELRMISDRTGILDFIVDSIGIGKGISDILTEDKRYYVQHFDSGAQASDPARFANRRAEMWWICREDVAGFDCCYPDEEVVRQVPFASRYKIGSNGKIQMILKDKIKAELGRSPDDAESWAMGRYGIRRARMCLGKMIEHVVKQFTPTDSVEDYDLLGINRYVN